MQTQMLPRHEMAGRVVLGAAMTQPTALADVMASMVPEDWLSDSDQRIARMMGKMYNNGRHVDILTLADALRASGELDGLGGTSVDGISVNGLAYLADFGNGIPRNASIAEYIRILKDRSLARKGIFALQAALDRLMAQAEPAAQTLDGLMRTLTEERPSDSRKIREFVPAAMAALEPDNYTLIKTGVDTLDLITLGGGRCGELWIVGGDPSSGKSALVRQIERSAVAQGFPVHAFSIEVSGMQWAQLHMANLAGLPLWKVRQPHLLSVVDKDRMRSAGASLDRWPHTLDDAGSMHIDTLLSKARLSVMKQGTKVVTIDYLQMLDSSKKEIREQLGDSVKRLKQFAKDENCLVIALSQLNRAASNEEPNMRRLKDSSWLEQVGDVIALTHRPMDDNNAPTGEDKIIIAKQRNGARATLDMRLDVNTLCWGARYASEREQAQPTPISSARTGTRR